MKIGFHGIILGVQPRIRLTRSFDQRSHTYLGFALRLVGLIDSAEQEFSVGISPAAQAEHRLRFGDEVRGACEPVADSRTETVGYYKVSELAAVLRAPDDPHQTAAMARRAFIPGGLSRSRPPSS